MTIDLKPCPFCGRIPPDDLSDTLYPSGTVWREHDGIRSYHRGRKVGWENKCYSMNCTTNEGGCGASIDGDSKEEAIAVWNRRASAPPVILPTGWKLVPVEPTPEMLLTAHDYDVFDKLRAVAPSAISLVAKSIYKGMLAAAPALQEGSEQPPEHQQEGQPAVPCAAPADQPGATWPGWNPSCGCATCNPHLAGQIMFLCSTCGNKRCPHDRARTCTNSNEPGQPGSAYGPQIAAPVEQTTSTDTNNEKGQA